MANRGQKASSGEQTGDGSSANPQFVPRSKYAITKPYGGLPGFMASHGLKIYDMDDIDEANRIIEGFQDLDRRDWEEEQAAKQRN